MKKKWIIIIAIVVVVLFLLYKNGTFDSLLNKSSDSTSTDTSTDTDIDVDDELDADDYKSVINHTSITGDAKTQALINAKGLIARGENLGTTTRNGGETVKVYDLEVQSAKNYGITLTQQLCRSAIQMLVNQKIVKQTVATKYMNEILAQ